jgi:hypothetical protein
MQELLQSERDKKRNGEVLLDGVEVVEVDDMDLDDFQDSSLIDPTDLPTMELGHIKQELFEIRELLAQAA